VTKARDQDDYFSLSYRDYKAQNPNRKLDHYLAQIEKHTKQNELTLFDVGCGLGLFLNRASEQHPAWQLWGTDVDPVAVAEVNKLVPTASVQIGSADTAAHAAESFDVITAWDVLEHVEGRDAAGAAIQTMLKPNGLFCFVVPVYDGPLGPLVSLLDKDPTHVLKEARQSWLAWAGDNFEIVEWHGVFRYLVNSGWYVHRPTTRARSIAPAILVVSRKTI
jgi:2-polyprenyl-3-methyl-5-hydroxy-6-metoxy-1,4-benzoquinol methylase